MLFERQCAGIKHQQLDPDNLTLSLTLNSIVTTSVSLTMNSATNRELDRNNISRRGIRKAASCTTCRPKDGPRTTCHTDWTVAGGGGGGGKT
jgi:hypothetical protein